MGYRRFSILARHNNFENAKLILRHWCCLPVPIVELADEVGSEGIGSPFAVDDIAVIADIEAELFVALAFRRLAPSHQVR